MTGGDQLAEGAQQFGDIVEVEACGGLVEQKQLAFRLRRRLNALLTVSPAFNFLSHI